MKKYSKYFLSLFIVFSFFCLSVNNVSAASFSTTFSSYRNYVVSISFTSSSSSASNIQYISINNGSKTFVGYDIELGGRTSSGSSYSYTYRFKISNDQSSKYSGTWTITARTSTGAISLPSITSSSAQRIGYNYDSYLVDKLDTISSTTNSIKSSVSTLSTSINDMNSVLEDIYTTLGTKNGSSIWGLMNNYLPHLQTINSKLGALGDVNTYGTILKNLNDISKSLNSIGDVNTYGTVLKNLKDISNILGDVNTYGTILKNIKDLSDKLSSLKSVTDSINTTLTNIYTTLGTKDGSSIWGYLNIYLPMVQDISSKVNALGSHADNGTITANLKAIKDDINSIKNSLSQNSGSSSLSDELKEYLTSFQTSFENINNNLISIFNKLSELYDYLLSIDFDSLTSVNDDGSATNIWDFLIAIIKALEKLFSNLFIFDGLSDIISQFINLFSDKLGFLFYPFDFSISLYNRMSSIGSGDGIISSPNISINKSVIIPSFSINLSTLAANFLGDYYNIYYSFVDLSIFSGLLYLAKKKFDEIFGGGDSS